MREIEEMRAGPVARRTYTRALPAKPILGYWDIRGLGEALRYQLIYQGIDFEDKHYTPDERGKSWFVDDKPNLGLDFPNIPYFVDTDGFCLTEHLAVHHYIALKWNPELLGETP